MPEFLPNNLSAVLELYDDPDRPDKDLYPEIDPLEPLAD
jgi:hypothetical protein